MKSTSVQSITRSVPKEVTRPLLTPLHTPVTCAPACLASRTSRVPTAPDAPLTSIVAPIESNVLQEARAVAPPRTKTSVTAFSNVMLRRSGRDGAVLRQAGILGVPAELRARCRR